MSSFPQIKICGITEISDVENLLDLQVDYLGFVFYSPSPRYVGNKISSEVLALKMASQKADKTKCKKIGVFVSEQPKVVLELVQKYELDYVQLHGDESEQYLLELKKFQPKLGIIKAFRVEASFDFALLESYRSIDFFLFDTYKTAQPGGTGASFNWTILQSYKLDTPYFLSGGLGLHNVEAALDLAAKDSRLQALDFNSALEITPGVKDIDKCKELIGKIHD